MEARLRAVRPCSPAGADTLNGFPTTKSKSGKSLNERASSGCLDSRPARTKETRIGNGGCPQHGERLCATPALRGGKSLLIRNFRSKACRAVSSVFPTCANRFRRAQSNYNFHAERQMI